MTVPGGCTHAAGVRGVVSTKVLRDRTGASKQAGFVQMATKEGAQAAVSQLSGREVGEQIC